jgi:DNA-binding transcriptional LysR family regulator
MELNSVEAIIQLVRQGLGYSIVPKLANIAWENDRQLTISELPGKTIYRKVGLLEKRKHSRQNITQEIKKYFLEHNPKEKTTPYELTPKSWTLCPTKGVLFYEQVQ